MSISRRHSGFTLLELILALAMVAMLAGSLYASLRIGFRARDAALRAIGPVRALTIAMDMIGHDLENALPPNGTLAGAFIGEQAGTGDNSTPGDLLEFYFVGEGPDHPDPTAWGGIRKVDLVVMPADNSGTLVLTRQVTTNLLAQVVPDPDQEVICRGVKSFTLQYFDGTMWQPVWDSTQVGNVLPMAVAVTLEIQWPPLRPGESPAIGGASYKMTRIYYLPMNQPIDPNAVGTTGTGTTGGTGLLQ